jgi:tetratricopeptide (TPR) repeat protein
MAMMLIAALAGCESKTDGNDGKEPAEAPAAPEAKSPAAEEPETGVAASAPSTIYAPGGLDGATVSIKPLGKAFISVVAGYPTRIHEGAGPGEFRQARLAPGDYILRVGNIEARQGLNLSFRGEAGDYYALALTYSVDGALFWTPVIVSGAPNGPIAADKDGLLVGKTQAEAVRLLTASSSQQTAAVTSQKKAEDEAKRKEAEQANAAKVKVLFEKGAKAHKADRLDEALQALDEALMIAPNFDSALALRGVVLGRMKQLKPALESLDKAIRVGRNTRGANDEWLHWPWLEKGVILLAARKPDLAHEAFGESIRVKPTIKALIARASLSFARGQALGKKEDWAGAAPLFKSAQADADKGIEIDPKSIKLWSIKTGTHIMLNEHEQACSAMRKACDLGNCSILKQYPQCKPGGS